MILRCFWDDASIEGKAYCVCPGGVTEISCCIQISGHVYPAETHVQIGHSITNHQQLQACDSRWFV